MEFQFGGHQVRLVLRDLPGDHNYSLNNWLGIGASMNRQGAQPGLAQIATILAGVKRLTVDGEDIPLNPNGNRDHRIPRIMDYERRISLMDYILGLVVERNEWLLWDDSYRPVFKPYLDKIKEAEEEAEEEGEPELSIMQNPT